MASSRGKHARVGKGRRGPIVVTVAVAVVAAVTAIVWWQRQTGPQPVSAQQDIASIAPVAANSPAADVATGTGPTPSPTPPKRRDRPPKEEEREHYAPTGRLTTVPGTGGPASARYRFEVQVEDGLPIDERDFAEQVTDVLNDPRSWAGSFERGHGSGVDFTVVLASPGLTDELCAPLITAGTYSCFQRGNSVLNWSRWRHGADAYGGDLERYRIYLIEHEVGHALGHGHATCPGSGGKAPVMMQQTKGVSPCRANPWPLGWERG